MPKFKMISVGLNRFNQTLKLKFIPVGLKTFLLQGHTSYRNNALLMSCRTIFISSASQGEETHFGYRTVTKEEKAEKVHDVFENVADKYDLMNDLMSGGIHRFWKNQFVANLGPTVGIKLLDVAGGTGDISFRVLQYLNNEMKSKQNDVDFVIKSDLTEYEKDINAEKKSMDDSTHELTVCDISSNMLEVGKKRAEELGFHNIKWVCGDAQELPFQESLFDAYTIAFGMRNVVDIEKALHEAYRVLKPGGRFLCLEFSHVDNPLIRKIYDTYSFQMIPVMGQVVAADWESYQYLVESIRKFPDQETYKDLIESAGFRKVCYKNMTFGVTSIHSGFKI